MEISAKMVQELREKTGAGIMDCKKALAETQGNLDQASDFLRKKGLASAEKKLTRSASDGLVFSYIHGGGKIGVMVEVNCETDFVARTADFQDLCKDIAMHIAATNSLFVKREQVPASFIEKEKDLFYAQAKESGKPENMLGKIVEGKLSKFLSEICLMDQPFIKNPDQTIDQLIKEKIAKLGENIHVARFARFQLGETASKTNA